jgi:hypothetical protein
MNRSKPKDASCADGWPPVIDLMNAAMATKSDCTTVMKCAYVVITKLWRQVAPGSSNDDTSLMASAVPAIMIRYMTGAMMPMPYFIIFAPCSICAGVALGGEFCWMAASIIGPVMGSSA